MLGTNLRFETMLVRMESIHAPLNEDQEEAVQWDVSLNYTGDAHPIFTGHLFRPGKEGFGQALAVGIVTIPKSVKDAVTFDMLVEYAHSGGWIESLYDVARRGLSAQAALMDFDIGLPTKAPEAIIQDANTEDESSEQ